MFNINSIRNKLILIGVLVALSMLAMIILQKSINSSLNNISQTNLRVSSIQSGMLTLRRHEKDFLMRLDVKYFQKFNDEVTSLISNVEILKIELEQQDDAARKASKLKDILIDYKKKFEALVRLEQNLGLDANSGLYGNLRAAVHQVESKINELNNDRLLANLLMLRRHEKDFMLRDDLKYFDRFNRDLIVFMTSLNTENIADDTKSAITSLMQNYSQSFKGFISGKQALGLTSSDGALGELRETVHQTEGLLTTLAEEIEITSIEHRAFTNLMSIIIALLITLVIVGVVERSR